MSDRIAPAPDTSDERLTQLIGWTSKAGMPDVHAMLLDLHRHRTAVVRFEESLARMLLEVETLQHYVERGDSRHPRTVEAVRNVLDAIRKAGG